MESNDAATDFSRRRERPKTVRLESDGVRLDFVRLPELGFWLSRMPVSRAAFRTACETAGPGGTQPATAVSWSEASRFCKWMNLHGSGSVPSGFVFRLPTATEWASCVTGRNVSTTPWGEVCPEFGDPDMPARVQARGHPLPIAVLAGRRVREPGLWQWTGDLYDPGANLRILRGACWYGKLDGRDQFLYYRTPHPDEGRPEIAFRIVAAPA